MSSVAYLQYAGARLKASSIGVQGEQIFSKEFDALFPEKIWRQGEHGWYRDYPNIDEILARWCMGRWLARVCTLGQALELLKAARAELHKRFAEEARS